MKTRTIVIRGIAAAAVGSALASCTTVNCAECRPLPSTGTYRVCSVDDQGAKHIQKDERIRIGPIGNVTRVSYGPKDAPRVRVQVFQGAEGLVGFLPRANDADEDHVVVIGTTQLEREVDGCKPGPVITIKFVVPDTDGKYRGSRSGPHYGHAHGEIESLVPPPPLDL